MSDGRWLWCQMCGGRLPSPEERESGRCLRCSPLQEREMRSAPYRWTWQEDR